MINVHKKKKRARWTEWTALSQTGGHSATLIEHIYLTYLFYITKQNKTGSGKDSFIQESILLDTYTHGHNKI